MSPLDESLRARIPSVLARARSLLGLGGSGDALSSAELARAVPLVERLHRGLVGERVLAHSSTYDDPKHLGAYLLWWWPQSYTRTRAALAMRRFDAHPAATVLDLGAGPAPGACAAVDHLRGGSTRARAVDASARALAEGARLLEGLQTQVLDLSAALPSWRSDVVVAANMLSELPGDPEAKAAWVGRVLDQCVEPTGRLVLIEPALRETSRALLEVRDRVLGPSVFAHAPCFGQMPCPALLHPRDWCTAEIVWEPPRHIVQLSRALGLHADAPLSFTLVVLSRAAPPPALGRMRVVGVPPEEKGKRRLFVCGENQRVAVGRLDRDAGPANAAFDELARGDVARFERLEQRGDGLRLGRDGSVERVEGEP